MGRFLLKHFKALVSSQNKIALFYLPQRAKTLNFSLCFYASMAKRE